MKSKHPSQIELATLAANLPTGSAPERVKLAVQIWQEAGNETDGTAETHRAIARLDSHAAAPVPLEWLLAEIMPKRSKAERTERWERFIRWKMENARDAGTIYGTRSKSAILPEDKITPAEARELAEGEIRRHEAQGVPRWLAASDQFEGWQLGDKTDKAVEKAKVAAQARWENEQPPSKARGKTHQVKKKAKS